MNLLRSTHIGNNLLCTRPNICLGMFLNIVKPTKKLFQTLVPCHNSITTAFSYEMQLNYIKSQHNRNSTCLATPYIRLQLQVVSRSARGSLSQYCQALHAAAALVCLLFLIVWPLLVNYRSHTTWGRAALHCQAAPSTVPGVPGSTLNMHEE